VKELSPLDKLGLVWFMVFKGALATILTKNIICLEIGKQL
jgi:hypothetical protein